MSKRANDTQKPNTTQLKTSVKHKTASKKNTATAKKAQRGQTAVVKKSATKQKTDKQPKKQRQTPHQTSGKAASKVTSNTASKKPTRKTTRKTSKTARKKIKPTLLDASALGLKRENLPSSILEVIRKLTAAGFDAYIVGGGVRDELLGLEPKDFDAVTNATPAEVKAVFGKRCRIIGRRFQLAHVYSGRDMIEVATFRAPPSQKSGVNDSGMVVRDNVWGTIEQDFVRRDFTINAMYYQPLDNVVLDFCDALSDVKARRLSFLGDTQTRIDEDPVRLLRAIRFAAKLDLSMDDDIVASFTHDNWSHLQTVSPHRLYDESLKMFGGGYVSKALPLLKAHNALDYLFASKIDDISPLVAKVADNTDVRIQSGKSINPAFFYAALLWPAYQKQTEKLKQNIPLVEAMNKAAIRVINAQRNITAIPRFSESFIRETWSLQPRLITPKPRQVPALVEQQRFRAGYDFLYLREQSGDADTLGMGQWWHDYQEMDTNSAREQAIKALNRQQLKAKRQPVALDESASMGEKQQGSQRKLHTTLPKHATEAALPLRRRRQRSQPVASTAGENYKHILADAIRGERPETHD